MCIISIKNLTKQFDNLVAVDHISFKVKKGEIFGLLGPNGAGKTTTVNMLCTLLTPTSGYAKVDEHDVYKNKVEIRKSIGLVFQEPALDSYLTARENLEFHAMIYGMEKKERNKRIDEMLNLVELKDKADELIGNFSGGMKRRLEIARGLIHKPKILFLDEPTLGLDVQTRRHIWGYINKLNKKEKITIILTTHYLEEADRLCDRIAIIDHGRIIVTDSPHKLKEKLGGDIISLKINNNFSRFANELGRLKWIREVKASKGNMNLFLTVKEGNRAIPKIVYLAQKLKIKINEIDLHKPSLEDVFVHFTGSSIRERENNGKLKLENLRKKMVPAK